MCLHLFAQLTDVNFNANITNILSLDTPLSISTWQSLNC